MNRIRLYLDTIFMQYDSTKEAEDFHEEVLRNCRDRYQECLDSGMSDEEAQREVISHLGDIEDVLREMSDESARDSWKNLARTFAETVLTAARSVSDLVNIEENTQDFIYTEISDLKIHTKNSDIRLNKSENDDLRAVCDPERFTLSLREHCLEIRQSDTRIPHHTLSSFLHESRRSRNRIR